MFIGASTVRSFDAATAYIEGTSALCEIKTRSFVPNRTLQRPLPSSGSYAKSFVIAIHPSVILHSAFTVSVPLAAFFSLRCRM